MHKPGRTAVLLLGLCFVAAACSDSSTSVRVKVDNSIDGEAGDPNLRVHVVVRDDDAGESRARSAGSQRASPEGSVLAGLSASDRSGAALAPAPPAATADPLEGATVPAPGSIVSVTVPGVEGSYEPGQTRIANFDLGVELTSIGAVVLRFTSGGACTRSIPGHCTPSTSFNIGIREPWSEGDPPPVLDRINHVVARPSVEMKAELLFASGPIPVEKTCYGYRFVVEPDPLEVLGDGTGSLVFQLASGTGTITSAELEVEGTIAPQPAPDVDADGIEDAQDNCVHWPNPRQEDVDANRCGNACECGDQNGDGRVDVLDIAAINQALFHRAAAGPLCDTNGDDRCNVSDILGVARKISGAAAFCLRFPRFE